MATANFEHPYYGGIWALFPQEVRVCPECGYLNLDDATRCDDCGADISGISSKDAEEWFEWDLEDIQRDIDEANKNFVFWKLRLASGYYHGAQVIIEPIEDIPENMDNDECRYFFDMCRSVAIRRSKAEFNRADKIRRSIPGIKEFAVIGRFQNGEVIYREA